MADDTTRDPNRMNKVRAALDDAEQVDLGGPNSPDPYDEPPADYDGDRDQGQPDYDPSEFDRAPDHDDGADADGPTSETLRECAALALNDYGNGLRFARYFGEDGLWVPRVGWFVWTGQVWKKDPDGILIRRKSQQVSVLIGREVDAIHLGDKAMAFLAQEKDLKSQLDAAEDEEVKASLQAKIEQVNGLKRQLQGLRKGHRNFARTSGNSARIEALLKEASVSLSRPFDDLDAGELDVNTQSGVLRFKVVPGEEGSTAVASVELVPHARDQLITKMMPLEYDPSAKAPLFHAFLDRIQPHAEMRGFLQRWFGLSLTALTREQKLAFLYGHGGNGKSVLVDLLAKMAGDYSSTAKIESLIGRNRRSGGDATPDLVPLMGARMVRASEPEEGERLQEGKIKELTGGEPLLVRALQEDFVEVQPVFKLTISGNHKPEIRGTDDGIWRRLLLVPFDVQIPKAERDMDLPEKLWAERSGILNWLIEGLLDYLEGGLREPEAVLAATAEFREQSDPIAAFLIECTVVSGDAADFTRASDLKDAFLFWLRSRGEGSWGDRTVSNRLKDKAGKWQHPASGQKFTRAKSSDWGYRGIKFTDDFRTQFDGRPKDAPGSYRQTVDGWDDGV